MPSTPRRGAPRSLPSASDTPVDPGSTSHEASNSTAGAAPSKTPIAAAAPHWRLVRHQAAPDLDAADLDAADLDEAVADLVEHLQRAADVQVTVVTAGDGAPGSGAADTAAGTPLATLHVGRDAWIDARVSGLAELDSDGFALESLDADTLVIAGPTPAGTRHGVCEFLESVVGVRWLFPGPLGQVVPRHQDLRLSQLHLRREPVFTSRTQPGLATPAQQLWGRRLRLRQNLCGATHSLQSLLAPARYAASHPQFFPVVDGERYLDPKGWDWHPCFCADGLPEELARLASEHFDTHPQERCFSLAISDGAVHCECERCAALERGRRNGIAMRHVSEQFFTCMNRVAELVAEVHPDRLLGGLAYANLYDPPTTVPVHPNLVLFHTCDRHKWLHPELARRGHAASRAWAATGARLCWYDYTFGAGFPIPRLYPGQMAAAYRFARDVGVEGIAAETCHNWLEAPKYYLLARLQWDPDTDVEASLDEWYELTAGAAGAPHLKAFYQHWERVWTEGLTASRAFSLEGQQWLPIQDDTCLDLVSADDVRRGGSLLRAAVDAAGGEPERARCALLLRGYAFCEAAVLGRLPDHEAGRAAIADAEAAVRSVDAAVTAASWTACSHRLDADLAEDEILRRTVVPWWSGTDRRGWGVYPLWRVLEWIAEDAGLHRHVEAVADGATDLAPWARSLLGVVDGTASPLAELSLGADARLDLRRVDDDTRRAKEPGEAMSADAWQVWIGDDVEPFWNPPRPGRDGRVVHAADAGRRGGGALRFCGTTYATARHRVALPETRCVALAYVRWTHARQTTAAGGTGAVTSAPASGTAAGSGAARDDGPTPAARPRLELRLWSIRWADHNPSPHVTVVHPPAGAWVPVALPVDLAPRAPRPVDYRLLEVVVEGVTEGDAVEVSDVAVWPV